MPSEPQVYESLRAIIADVFLRDDIVLRPGLAASDVDGWDSFKHLEIIMACEEKFGIRFTTPELDSFLCLGDIVACIVKKTT